MGDPILESNLTRRVDFALFMVEALENDELIHEAPGNRRPTDALGARPCRQRLNSLECVAASLARIDARALDSDRLLSG